ncbi:hypothetical protein SLS60_002568 [Paraconiothyrium brasiliense]|uniref:Uncharacterized protein n=1 Tax=Paraconiothyrium brasiliense TaxID=300254 RepID=A0ABR3RU56_9PLEO
MHSFAFISTFLPALVLAALPQNVTYPRHVLSAGHITSHSGSAIPKRTVTFDAPRGVFTGPVSICTQPIVTITTTVTDVCLDLAHGKPTLGSLAHGDSEHEIPEPSKSATYTWVDSSITITGVAPWPLITKTAIRSGLESTRFVTYDDWAETYSVSTATLKWGATSYSGIWINPAFTERHVADQTRTSTLVHFQTKTRVPAHTTVPKASATADGSSEGGIHPSETRLPEHPNIPASGANPSQIKPQVVDPGYYPWGEEHEDEHSDGEPGREKLDYYVDSGDEDEEENVDEYVDNDDTGLSLMNSYNGTQVLATATLKKPQQTHSSQITDHGTTTSSPTEQRKTSSRTPASKPRPTEPRPTKAHVSSSTHRTTGVYHTAVAYPSKNFTALTMLASSASTILSDTVLVHPMLPTNIPIEAVPTFRQGSGFSSATKTAKTTATTPKTTTVPSIPTSQTNTSSKQPASSTSYSQPKTILSEVLLSTAARQGLKSSSFAKSASNKSKATTSPSIPSEKIKTSSKQLASSTSHSHPESLITESPLPTPLQGSKSSSAAKSALTKPKATATPLIPSSKIKTSSSLSASSTSHSHSEPPVLDIPLPTLPYSKTYVAQFPLSSPTLSYKPVHHGHISVTSHPSQSSKATETDDLLFSPSSTVTAHPPLVSTSGTGEKSSKETVGQPKPTPGHLRPSIEYEKEFCDNHCQEPPKGLGKAM